MRAPDSGLRVANPVRYGVVEPPPLRQIKLRPDIPIAGAVPQPKPKPRHAQRRAVLVCHGMGQQVAFENIDLVASALEKTAGADETARSASDGKTDQAKARFAKLGDDWLPRAEVKLRRDGHEVDVHVYEAYWAPLTEGKVSAFAVTRFLVGAGLRGLGSTLHGTFDRWMFGRRNEFRLSWGAGAALVLAFALVVSTLVLYLALGGLLLLEGMTLLLGPLAPSSPASALEEMLGQQLLRSPLVLPLVLLPALAARWLVLLVHDRLRVDRDSAGRSVVGMTAALAGAGAAFLLPFVREIGSAVLEPTAVLGVEPWALLGATVAIGVAAAVVCGVALGARGAAPALTVTGAVVVGAWLLGSCALLAWSLVRIALGMPGHPGVETALDLKPLPEILFLGLAAVACIWLRGFYIQYLGDVAVYLSSHHLNVFHELRAKIRDVGFRTACAIYGARSEDGSDWLYDEVVVVGHSLGSVVAYDTLNGVLNDDRLRGGELEAEGRTRALVTFGSPLDKSAFIFRTQVQKESRFREALAAAVQPLVQPVPPAENEPERGRTIPWRNVYSPFDPISGHLGYYDPPEGEPRPEGHEDVDNRVDARAGILGYAHVMYWDNPELNGYLYEQLAARELRVAKAGSAKAG